MSMRNATKRRTNPGRVTVCISVRRGGNSRSNSMAQPYPITAPDVFHIRSSTSNRRYEQGNTPITPVSCIVSTSSDARKPTGRATANFQRNTRFMMKPRGTKNTTFITICRIAVSPSARISPMNCNGLSCGCRWWVAQYAAGSSGIGYSVKHSRPIRYSTVAYADSAAPKPSRLSRWYSMASTGTVTMNDTSGHNATDIMNGAEKLSKNPISSAPPLLVSL